MKALFEEFPRLEGERLLLREWALSDAAALEEIIRDPDVYRFLPTFLYEQSLSDTVEMIAGSRAACFDTKESILFGVCFRDASQSVVGIAEIYNY